MPFTPICSSKKECIGPNTLRKMMSRPAGRVANQVETTTLCLLFSSAQADALGCCLLESPPSSSSSSQMAAGAPLRCATDGPTFRKSVRHRYMTFMKESCKIPCV